MNLQNKVIRGITKPDTLKARVSVLVSLHFTHLPEAELNTLTAVIHYSINNSLAITPDLSKQIRKETPISESSFSTALYRLERRGVINRTSKTITIHPIFKGVGDMGKLVVSFGG